jgi:dihydrofolate reductase
VYNVIAAIDSKRGLAREGQIPWDLAEDRRFFREITTHTKDKDKQNVVVMGRKTWESLAARCQPFPDRINMVLSHRIIKPRGSAIWVRNWQALEQRIVSLVSGGDVEKVFIIGGAEIYKQALEKLNCKKLYLTEIQKDFNCDLFFPVIEAGFKEKWRSEVYQENGVSFCFTELIEEFL